MTGGAAEKSERPVREAQAPQAIILVPPRPERAPAEPPRTGPAPRVQWRTARAPEHKWAAPAG
jgi:hypothetical protein